MFSSVRWGVLSEGNQIKTLLAVSPGQNCANIFFSEPAGLSCVGSGYQSSSSVPSVPMLPNLVHWADRPVWDVLGCSTVGRTALGVLKSLISGSVSI